MFILHSVEVAGKGQQLLQLVECSSLEREFSDLMEEWTTVRSAVDNELKRSGLTLSFIDFVFLIAFCVFLAPYY